MHTRALHYCSLLPVCCVYFFSFFSSVHLSHPGRLYHSIAPWELLRRLPFVCCCVLPSLPILMLLLSLGSLSRLSSNMFDVSSFKFCLLICVGDIFSKHHFLSSFLPSRFPLKWPVAFHFSVCVCLLILCPVNVGAFTEHWTQHWPSMSQVYLSIALTMHNTAKFVLSFSFCQPLEAISVN
mgnify:CR=1 FL=1